MARSARPLFYLWNALKPQRESGPFLRLGIRGKERPSSSSRDTTTLPRLRSLKDGSVPRMVIAPNGVQMHAECLLGWSGARASSRKEELTRRELLERSLGWS